MTAVSTHIAVPATGVGRRALLHLPDACVGVALAWWATYLTWGVGGREPHVLSIGCVLLALAFVAVRPWEAVPPSVSGVVHAVGVAAWLVVLTAPTGWAGADDVASYTYAAELGLVVYAWASTAVRRQVLVAAVVGAAGAQFAAGWVPWWGNQDASSLFLGTFYWHNQVGIFLAVGAILGLTAVAAGRPLALLGWAVTPLCVAGVVYTSSRGSQLALALGALMVLALVGRRLHVLGALALSWGVAWLLTGPPFFAERISPTAATEARSSTFVGNGMERLKEWDLAWSVFGNWPVSGAGFNSFDSAVVAAGEESGGTAFAHNGYLQVAADGGLTLLVPFLGLLLIVCVRAAADLPAAVRERDVVRVGGAAALVALLLHSGMDFDWTYPALLAMTALVAVLALPLRGPLRRPPGRLDLVLGGLGVVLLLAGAWAGWDGGMSLNAVVS